MSIQQVADGFQELTQVCRPRPDQNEGNIEAGARRLFKMLGEYEEPIALKALDAWPRKSEWFPTEFELRGLCDELTAEAAHEGAGASYIGGGRYHKPDGMVFQFVERVRDVRGDGYVKSWLAGGVTCQFAHNKIYTTGIGAERLHKEFGALAYELGVAIIEDKECSKMLTAYCVENNLQFNPKRPRR